MNLKKSFVGLVAVFALIGSIAAPVAAGPSGDSANVSITVLNGGTFDLDIVSDLALPAVTLDASNAWQTNAVTGTLNFKYTDTKASRSGFRTQISATDFHGTYNSYTNTIPVSNFVITYLPNPQQLYCCRGNYGIAGISNSATGFGNATSTSSADWSPGVSFGDNPTLHLSWAGRGTGETTAQADVKLTIPSTTAQDDYLTVVTATVSFGEP